MSCHRGYYYKSYIRRMSCHRGYLIINLKLEGVYVIGYLIINLKLEGVCHRGSFYKSLVQGTSEIFYVLLSLKNSEKVYRMHSFTDIHDKGFAGSKTSLVEPNRKLASSPLL